MRKILALFISILLILAMPAQAVTLSLKDYNNGHIYFDDAGKKIGITLNTGSDGVLYVYSGERSALSDSTANLLYVEYIYKSDGDIVKDISLANIGTKYGSYKVDFYGGYPDTSIASAGFVYYSPAQVLQNKRNAIFDSLMAITEINGTAIEAALASDADVFALISSDADMTNYNKVVSKSSVYFNMVSGVASLNNYEEMISLFETAALDRYNQEQNNPQLPSDITGQRPTTNVMTTTGGGGGASSNPTVPVTPPSDSGFSDMKNHWAESYANRLKTLGIMNGYEDGSFNGEKLMTRAELAKTLVVAYGIPSNSGAASFGDVNTNDWHYKYICDASAIGLINGYDGNFYPNDNTTRQDAALMIYRALALKISMSVSNLAFSDTALISDYANEAVASLVNLNIITGDDNNCFNPLSTLTRAELAALICRSLDIVNSK